MAEKHALGFVIHAGILSRAALPGYPPSHALTHRYAAPSPAGRGRRRNSSRRSPPTLAKRARARRRRIRCSRGLGIASHERDQKCLNEAHRQDACHDRCASKHHRRGLHRYEAAQKCGDRRKNTHRVRHNDSSARLTIDLAPRAKARLSHHAHRRAAAVGTFDHYGAPNDPASPASPQAERSSRRSSEPERRRIRCDEGFGAGPFFTVGSFREFRKGQRRRRSELLTELPRYPNTHRGPNHQSQSHMRFPCCHRN